MRSGVSPGFRGTARHRPGRRAVPRKPGETPLRIHARPREDRAPGDRLMPGAWRFAIDPTEFLRKRALVTGGTKGIGEALVRRLAAGGAKVATTARSELPEGQSPDLFIRADVGTAAGVEKVVRTVLDRFGDVDLLVHNVGGSSR